MGLFMTNNLQTQIPRATFNVLAIHVTEQTGWMHINIGVTHVKPSAYLSYISHSTAEAENHTFTTSSGYLNSKVVNLIQF